ncbi:MULTISPECIES: type IA DNA topoisomerase [Dysgonomonas]|uniref:type IA DNA topoisomerase n=1 Tax=Dysgonomonas TaxID=156973 RepID=UPI0009284CE6|nr:MULTISPECIES: type IA DNA topoisomerase [Dysgonomonas]MBN9302539.1 DNA topoisomerase III [Dysgonomonas mossii]OJX59480.1 MAG: DNA topoisomerase III [Dysgonomonas sp. 37-18]
MIAIIAEKPSVAREIAAIVGATDKKDGYISGNNYLVTWALGHLVGPAMPEQYGLQGFVREELPIIPEDFKLIPRQKRVGKEYQADPSALKQLKVIRSVFDECDKIIVATDAGREGELIFRYIYSYLGCRKPFDRLWISSLTDKAIREGLQNLKAGSSYDKLYDAAKARSEADWLVGINASQAISIAAGKGIFSLGRVQTPTLAMVCSRYLEHINFTPVPFWELRLDTSFANQSFSAMTKDRIESRSVAKDLFEKQKQQRAVIVQSIETKEIVQEPPLLYDLTSLQKDANSKYGFSADKTLSIAQKLYEAKYITYPRTGSRYISDDVFYEIPPLIDKLASHAVLGAYANKLSCKNLNTHPVDSKKVTDHHALLITGNIPDSISYDERKIYDMIAGRMLEAFSEKCVKDQTTITLNCADTLYIAKGSVIKIAGWREVFGKENKDKSKTQNKEQEQDKELPTLIEGQELFVSQIQLLEKLTKPKPLHTEASLLSSMESAGKDLEDEEQRLALKICGIGTPATRAAIIETLFGRGYMIRDKKSLVPTEKGLAVYDAVKDKRIADVEMTGMWEDTFAKIEVGTAEASNFKKGIEVYATQITDELLNTSLSLPKQETVNCPKCGLPINFYAKVAKCSGNNSASGAMPDCDLMLFTSLAGKTLSNDVLQLLLQGEQTATIKGFKSKAGKHFDAALVLDENFKIKFVFDNSYDKGSKFKRKK